MRANNGWLVAGLRTDLPARWIPQRSDKYGGVDASLSKDNGQTRSPVQNVHPGGRMHLHFVKLSNADPMVIYVIRQEIAPDGLHDASYRRGCEALISSDHGLAWDLSREYRLHEFDVAAGSEGTHEGISALAGGHIGSTLLDDGRIPTADGHDVANADALIRWRPRS